MTSTPERGVIVIGDVTLRFRPLTLGQARKYKDELDIQKMRELTGAAAMERMTALIPLFAEASKLDEEEIAQLVTVSNFHRVMAAMLQACWPEGVPEGEAEPVVKN